MSADSPNAEYRTPADFADMIQREAGKLYPRTVEPIWAATVAQAEAAAKRIRALGNGVQPWSGPP